MWDFTGTLLINEPEAHLLRTEGDFILLMEGSVNNDDAINEARKFLREKRHLDSGVIDVDGSLGNPIGTVRSIRMTDARRHTGPLSPELTESVPLTGKRSAKTKTVKKVAASIKGKKSAKSPKPTASSKKSAKKR